MSDSILSKNSLPLEAPLTSWFWRRYGVMWAVVFFLGLYFLYDGAIGYPKKDAKLSAAIEQREEIWGQNKTEEEKKRLWRKYTHDHGLNDQDTVEKLEEKIKGPKKTKEQFYYAAGCGVLVLGLGFWLFRQRKNMLALTAEGLKLPSGELVSYSQMQRIDRRKWHKGKAGLAYLFYQDQSGQTQRATIDGMKYGGFQAEEGEVSVPEKIMEKLLEHSHIELLDLADQVEQEEEKG